MLMEEHREMERGTPRVGEHCGGASRDEERNTKRWRTSWRNTKRWGEEHQEVENVVEGHQEVENVDGEIPKGGEY